MTINQVGENRFSAQRAAFCSLKKIEIRMMTHGESERETLIKKSLLLDHLPLRERAKKFFLSIFLASVSPCLVERA
jgi:hypothetical protein